MDAANRRHGVISLVLPILPVGNIPNHIRDSSPSRHLAVVALAHSALSEAPAAALQSEVWGKVHSLHPR